MPSASFTHSAVAAAPIDTVWQALQRADTWAALGPLQRVWDPEHADDGSLRGFHWGAKAAGRDIAGTAIVQRSDEPTHLQLDLVTAEITGSLEAELAEAGASTQVTVTMRLQPRGLLASMFFGVISKTVGDGLGDHVDEFAAGF